MSLDAGLQALIARAEQAMAGRAAVAPSESAAFERAIEGFGPAAQAVLRKVRGEALAGGEGAPEAKRRLDGLLAMYRTTCSTCGRPVGEIPGECPGRPR